MSCPGVQAGEGEGVAADHPAVCVQRHSVRVPGQRHHHPPPYPCYYQVHAGPHVVLQIKYNVI